MWANPMCRLFVFILITKTFFSPSCAPVPYTQKASLLAFLVKVPSPWHQECRSSQTEPITVSSFQHSLSDWSRLCTYDIKWTTHNLATGLSFVSAFWREEHVKIGVQICLKPQTETAGQLPWVNITTEAGGNQSGGKQSWHMHSLSSDSFWRQRCLPPHDLLCSQINTLSLFVTESWNISCDVQSWNCLGRQNSPTIKTERKKTRQVKLN